MNIQLPTIRTADDFLAAYEGVEGKFEFVNGKVVEHVIKVTRSHVNLAHRLTFALGSRLDPDAHIIGSADFGVRTEAGIRYPDVFVEAAGGPAKALVTDVPLLLAEILSSSSVALDFGEKRQEYTAIPSLLHYVVLSQDEPRVWLWQRGEEGAFGSPEMIVGREAVLPLTGFGIELALAELYRGIA